MSTHAHAHAQIRWSKLTGGGAREPIRPPIECLRTRCRPRNRFSCCYGTPPRIVFRLQMCTLLRACVSVRNSLTTMIYTMIHTHTRARAHTHTHTHYIYIYIYIYTRMYVCNIHTYIRIYVCNTYVYMHTYVCMYVCMYVYL